MNNCIYSVVYSCKRIESCIIASRCAGKF